MACKSKIFLNRKGEKKNLTIYFSLEFFFLFFLLKKTLDVQPLRIYTKVFSSFHVQNGRRRLYFVENDLIERFYKLKILIKKILNYIFFLIFLKGEKYFENFLFLVFFFFVLMIVAVGLLSCLSVDSTNPSWSVRK